jgi:hypothetical protein
MRAFINQSSWTHVRSIVEPWLSVKIDKPQTENRERRWTRERERATVRFFFQQRTTQVPGDKVVSGDHLHLCARKVITARRSPNRRVGYCGLSRGRRRTYVNPRPRVRIGRVCDQSALSFSRPYSTTNRSSYCNRNCALRAHFSVVAPRPSAKGEISRTPRTVYVTYISSHTGFYLNQMKNEKR